MFVHYICVSTRTNIHFMHSEDTIAANIYRHSDGYPSGVLPDLARFFGEVALLDDNRFSDPEYLASKFVVWQAAEWARDDNPLNFLSVGVCIRDHGDIEYTYEVMCNELTYRDGDRTPSVRWRGRGASEWSTWRVGQTVPEN